MLVAQGWMRVPFGARRGAPAWAWSGSVVQLLFKSPSERPQSSPEGPLEIALEMQISTSEILPEADASEYMSELDALERGEPSSRMTTPSAAWASAVIA